jgi:hypothetical protein
MTALFAIFKGSILASGQKICSGKDQYFAQKPENYLTGTSM